MIKNLFSWKRQPQGSSPDAEDAALPAAIEGDAEHPVLGTGDTPTTRHQQREEGGPSPEQIAARAYELWVQRGRPEGSGHEDWLEAERQLYQEFRSQPGLPDRAR